jgi:anthranilate phosphoribosyltransferase
MFAPAFHRAMRHAVGPRRELGLRTLFNVLGPLTNPAGVKRQVVGVFDAALCEPLAHALHALGSVHAMVVHGHGGLDEISLSGPTQVAELRDGKVISYNISPADVGLTAQSLEGLSVSSAAESAALIRSALGGRAGGEKAADMIALNAGATIYVSGIAGTLADGVVLAEDLIATGQAGEKLRGFVDFTRLMREERQ